MFASQAKLLSMRYQIAAYVDYSNVLRTQLLSANSDVVLDTSTPVVKWNNLFDTEELFLIHGCGCPKGFQFRDPCIGSDRSVSEAPEMYSGAEESRTAMARVELITIKLSTPSEIALLTSLLKVRMERMHTRWDNRWTVASYTNVSMSLLLWRNFLNFL